MSFLKQSAIGIMITDHVFEVVSLRKHGRTAAIRSVARAPLPTGIIEHGNLKDPNALRTLVTKTLKKAQPKPIVPRRAICAIPSAYTYIRTLAVPTEDKAASSSAITTYTQDSLPLAPDDVIYTYASAPQHDAPEKRMTVVASSKEILTTWHDFFASLKIEVAFAAGPLATMRAITLPQTDGPIVVLDMSHQVTTISRFDHSVCTSSHSRSFVHDPEPLSSIAKEIAHIAAGSAKKAPPPTIIFVPPRTDTHGLKEKLADKIGHPITVASPRLGQTPVAPITIGLALRGMKADGGIDPLLTIKKAHRVSAPDTASADAAGDNDTEQTNEEQDVEARIAASNEAKRLRKQKIVLGIIVLIGLVGLVGAYIFRAKEKAQLAEQREENSVQFTQTQSLSLTVPITTQEDDHTEQSVIGRIVTFTIPAAEDYREAIAKAKLLAEKDLSETERLAGAPLNPPADTAAISFPVTIEWLIYDKAQADTLLQAQLERLNTKQTPYALNLITVETIQPATTPRTYILGATVNISLNDLIPTPADTAPPSDQTTPAVSETPTTTSATEADTEIEGIILKTSTGWLNVRTGPGTTYELLDRVTPGDQYTIISSSGEWYEIVVADDITGWVSAEFVQVE